MESVNFATIITITIASLGFAGGIIVWALRLEGRMTTHEQTDELVHIQVTVALAEIKTTSIRTDEKVSWLVERLIPRA